MKILFSDKARKQYRLLSKSICVQFEKQTQFLITDMRHPSLQVKKYKGTKNKWQARVNDDYRFYFWIHEDIYFIVSIAKHPK